MCANRGHSDSQAGNDEPVLAIGPLAYGRRSHGALMVFSSPRRRSEDASALSVTGI
jgi:hypothetical protein